MSNSAAKKCIVKSCDNHKKTAIIGMIVFNLNLNIFISIVRSINTYIKFIKTTQIYLIKKGCLTCVIDYGESYFGVYVKQPLTVPASKKVKYSEQNTFNIT